MGRFGNKGNNLRKKFKRDASVYEERSTSSSRKYDSFLIEGVNKYSVKEVNVLRVLPPVWSEDPKELYSLIVHVHYGIGADSSAVLCPLRTFGKPCPICEEQERAQNEGQKDYAKELWPSKRFLSYVIDRQEEEKGVLLYNMPMTVDKELALKSVDITSREIINIDDVEEGYDISFKKTGSGKTGTKYEGIDIACKSTPLSNNDKQMDSWLQFVYDNPLPSILQEYTYEYLLDVFNGKPVQEKEESVGQETEQKENVQESKVPINLNDAKPIPTRAELLLLPEEDLIALTEEHVLFSDAEFDELDSLSITEFAGAIATRMEEKGIIKKPASRRRRSSATADPAKDKVAEMKSRFRK